MGEPSLGSTLAGYRLDALIDRGGMGVVYRATHLALERPVALKVIAPNLAADADFRARFLRESRLAARLDHPNVVPVFDAREEDDELIVAMRLIKGGDLKRRIAADGPLSPAEALALLGQVAEALDAAHAAGIVHRDVKPHNILLEGERAFLTDFGLAKALGESGVLRGASVVGTAEYMSPEQWRGREVGPPADVYSLGCVLYEALTGVVPYARHEGDAEPEIPAGLDEVIARAVAADPGERYPTAGALIDAARAHQSDAPAATRVLTDTAPTGRAGDFPPIRAAKSRHVGRGLVWGLAGVAVAVVVTVVAVLVLGGDDVSVSAPIEIGEGALRIAVDEDAIWVTSGADGTLTRIDPATVAVAGDPLRLDHGVAGVAIGEGSVWVSSPRRGDVLRVDPDSGRLVARIPVGGRPGAIVAGGGRIWVADEGGAGIAAINPRGGRVFKRGIAPRAAPLRLAVGAGAVWVSSASTGAVRRVDFGAATADAPIVVGRGPSGVTVGGGLVWVANSRANAVTRVDPVTRSLFGEPVEVGERPGGIDAGTEVVWVANNADGTVTRIEIESGETVGDSVPVGPRPGAVAVGGEAVWVANNGDGTVTRIEP